MLGEFELGEVALAGGAYVEERAAVAFWVREGAEGLGVELDEGVMLVEHGGVPGFGHEAHEAGLGGCGVGARDEAEALGDAEVVRVDGECAATKGGEVDDSGRGVGADAGKLLKPAADLIGAIFGEEFE